MTDLPVELLDSFLPWEEADSERSGFRGFRFFRVWLPGIMGGDDSWKRTDPGNKPGWAWLSASETLTGKVKGRVPGWRTADTWGSLGEAVKTVEDIAIGRGWSPLWHLAQVVKESP